MIDAVLLELEGVLVDTAAPRRRAMTHALSEEGLDVSGIEHTVRLPLREAVVRALRGQPAADDATFVDLLAAKSARYFAAEVATGLTLAPGAGAALEALRIRSRLALVTRADRSATERILSLGSLDGFFEVIVTADDVLEPKPHPESYRTALARLTSRRPAMAPIAIEDGLPGVRAARTARIPCVVISPVPAHEALEADAMIDGLAGHTLDSLSQLIATSGARVA